MSWQEKRQEVIDANGDECEVCGCSVNLNVHHESYRNYGNEDLDDLVVLCRKCHEERHGI